VLAGLIDVRAGDCASFLIPLTAGGDAAEPETGGMDEDAPRGPLNGLVEGVCAFPEDDGRDDLFPFMLSCTCRCCRRSASLSTMTPGVAELRAPGVFGSEPGLCRSLRRNCCFGAVDMLSFNLGCGGSSTLALAAASRSLNKSWENEYTKIRVANVGYVLRIRATDYRCHYHLRCSRERSSILD
jgi:hypothetical protein